MITASQGPSLLFLAGILFAFSFPIHGHEWDTDMELFDLVEEIPQTFYEFMSVEKDAASAEIKKAYRRLSLTLHPDKNKAENAETQFRQLVAIYEVLKDDERRQRYNDILINGLPDWRQPVFYYRRVRKMSNGELGFLLFLILTVCHYAVIWSIYLEKQLDELLSKKKREKKKKTEKNSKTAEEMRCLGQGERSHDKPHWQDILPLKVSIWLFLSVKALPQFIQEAKQYYEDYKEMKVKEKEEEQAIAEQETIQREKKPKVKKPKFEFPTYEPSVVDSALLQTYDQGTSIEEIEDQMDDWLDDRKSLKKKTPEWTEEDLSLLTRSMAKFPGGTPGRWEKIAHEMGRSVTDVITKVKQVKDCVMNTSGLVKLSELKGNALPPKASTAAPGAVPDILMTQRDEPSVDPGPREPDEGRTDVEETQVVRRRSKKPAGGDAGSEAKVKGRRQRDFDPTALAEDNDEENVEEGSSRTSGQQLEPREKSKEDVVWTQNQQKLLEMALQQHPRGTAERWDKIAKVVPGKSKEECMIRYKLLAELVLKRKQAKS